MSKSLTRVLLALLVLGGVSLYGGVILVTTEGGIAADGLIDWGDLGPAFTVVPNPSTVAVGGVPGLSADVSQTSGGPLERRDQGSGWGGNFGPGEELLWTQNDPGDMILVFSGLIQGAGAQIQRDAFGAFVATILAYDSGGVLLGSFDVPGSSTSAGDDSAIFIGILSDAMDIKTIAFRIDGGTQDFAINGPRIQTTGGEPGVPEPASLLLMGAGLLVLGAMAKRHRR